MKSFVLRIDEKIFDKIKTLAENDRRSINGEIDFIIRQYITKKNLDGDFPITEENPPTTS